MGEERKDEASQTISQFLLARGYDAAQSVDDVHDGHWILARIGSLSAACCRDSYKAGIEHAIGMLETGQYLRGEPLISGESDWTPDCSELVRRQMTVYIETFA